MKKLIAAAALAVALTACQPTTPTKVFDFCDSGTVPNFCVYTPHDAQHSEP